VLWIVLQCQRWRLLTSPHGLLERRYMYVEDRDYEKMLAQVLILSAAWSIAGLKSVLLSCNNFASSLTTSIQALHLLHSPQYIYYIVINAATGT